MEGVQNVLITNRNLTCNELQYLFVTYSSMSYCCRYETMISCLDPHAPRVEDVHTALCNIEKDSPTYLRNLFVKKRQPGCCFY